MLSLYSIYFVIFLFCILLFMLSFFSQKNQALLVFITLLPLPLPHFFVSSCLLSFCELFVLAVLASFCLEKGMYSLNRINERQLAELPLVIPLIYNCSHVLTAEGHLVTNRKRKEETNLMCSSRSYAPCCRVKAIHARWTSPPFCREPLTSCRNRKVGKRNTDVMN